MMMVTNLLLAQAKAAVGIVIIYARARNDRVGRLSRVERRRIVFIYTT
jgi:hypothetical protein